MRWTSGLAALAALVVACVRAENERTPPKPPPAVVGLATAPATLAPVRDVVTGFGRVEAAGEAPEVRDARAQLGEAEARQGLAEQQLRRLESLGHAVAPQ